MADAITAGNKILPSFAQTLGPGPMMDALLKPLADKLAGFPLASRVTLKLQMSRGMRQEGSPRREEPLTITTEVQSVIEAPLDERIVQVPDDYKKVDPPTGRFPFGPGRRD